VVLLHRSRGRAERPAQDPTSLGATMAGGRTTAGSQRPGTRGTVMTETRLNGGTERTAPELPVILPTSGTIESIRRALAVLGRQPVAERLEVVVAAPELGMLGQEPAEPSVFGATRLVEFGRGGKIAAGYGAGIRFARAPLVALAEDHCFPDPGWAAALIEAHRGPWAADSVRSAAPDPAVGDAASGTGVLPRLVPLLLLGLMIDALGQMVGVRRGNWRSRREARPFRVRAHRPAPGVRPPDGREAVPDRRLSAPVRHQIRGRGVPPMRRRRSGSLAGSSRR